MENPRRRAAGRPAGPPSTTVEKPTDSALHRAAEGAADAAADSLPGGGGQTESLPHRRRQRQPKVPEAHSETPPTGGRETSGPDQVHGEPPRAAPAARDERRRGESTLDRSLRALVSTRTTQLSPTVAMRAREAAVPSADDLAAADTEVVIVRRHYVPAAPLSTAKKGGPPGEGREAEQRAGGIENRRGRRPQRGAGS